MGVIERGFPGVARVNKVTPVSLRYPLSVFNKNLTLKQISIWAQDGIEGNPATD